MSRSWKLAVVAAIACACAVAGYSALGAVARHFGPVAEYVFIAVAIAGAWLLGRRLAKWATAARMTQKQRREALKDLARSWSGYGETVRSRRLADLVSAPLPDLDLRWDEFLGEIALLDGINAEPWATECHWSDVNDELVPPGQTEAARDEMAMRVAGVLDVLVRGIG